MMFQQYIINITWVWFQGDGWNLIDVNQTDDGMKNKIIAFSNSKIYKDVFLLSKRPSVISQSLSYVC